MGCSTSIVLPSGDKQFENIRFLQSSMKNLDRYFYRLHNTIRVESTDETVHLRDGVEKCVRSLVKLVSLKEPRLRVDNYEPLRIGSIYENTKIGAADQFDFIAVLSELGGNQILIEDLNHPVDVKLCMTPNEYLGDERKDHKEFEAMWADITEKGYLLGKKTTNSKKIGLLDIFEECVRQISGFIKPFKTKIGILEIDRTQRIRKEGPSVRINLKWTKSWFVIEESKRVDKHSVEIIAINITPAIQVKEVAEFVTSSDPISSSIYDKILGKGFLLFIPNYDGHFKKVFTDMEVGLMKELPERHIKAFRILKFLINGTERIHREPTFRNVDFMLFDSFAIKMLMLSNSESCPCMTYTEFELFDCVNHVLQIMYRNVFEDTDDWYHLYPNIFINSAPHIMYNSDTIRLNRIYLSELIKHDLKVWIGERERYDFRSNTKRFGIVPLNEKILSNLKILNPH